MSIYIVSGSTMGAAEIVAEEIQSHLQKSFGSSIRLLHSPKFEDVVDATHLCIICSTYGAGDYPDTFVPFVEELVKNGSKLNPSLRLCLVGLGSLDYDTFCQAIINLEQEFLKFGIKCIDEPLKIDCSESSPLPEEKALDYFKKLESKFFE